MLRGAVHDQEVRMVRADLSQDSREDSIDFLQSRRRRPAGLVPDEEHRVRSVFEELCEISLQEDRGAANDKLRQLAVHLLIVGNEGYISEIGSRLRPRRWEAALASQVATAPPSHDHTTQRRRH